MLFFTTTFEKGNQWESCYMVPSALPSYRLKFESNHCGAKFVTNLSRTLTPLCVIKMGIIDNTPLTNKLEHYYIYTERLQTYTIPTGAACLIQTNKPGKPYALIQ